MLPPTVHLAAEGCVTAGSGEAGGGVVEVVVVVVAVELGVVVVGELDVVVVCVVEVVVAVWGTTTFLRERIV